MGLAALSRGGQAMGAHSPPLVGHWRWRNHVYRGDPGRQERRPANGPCVGRRFREKRANGNTRSVGTAVEPSIGGSQRGPPNLTVKNNKA